MRKSVSLREPIEKLRDLKDEVPTPLRRMVVENFDRLEKTIQDIHAELELIVDIASHSEMLVCNYVVAGVDFGLLKKALREKKSDKEIGVTYLPAASIRGGGSHELASKKFLYDNNILLAALIKGPSGNYNLGLRLSRGHEKGEDVVVKPKGRAKLVLRDLKGNVNLYPYKTTTGGMINIKNIDYNDLKEYVVTLEKSKS